MFFRSFTCGAALLALQAHAVTPGPAMGFSLEYHLRCGWC